LKGILHAARHYATPQYGSFAQKSGHGAPLRVQMADSKCNNHLKLQSRFAGVVFANCQGHEEFQILSSGNAHRRSQSGRLLSSLGDPVLSVS
jgi:hypothetical protein